MTTQSAAKKFFQDTKVLVFGVGVLGGGAGVVETALQLGARVRITDQKTAEQLTTVLSTLNTSKLDKMTLGGHDESDIHWADVIIKNPAVPSDHPLLSLARSHEKHITTEAALYLKLSNAFTIGVTGTRGKTTTTLMIYEILKTHLPHTVLLGGNIQHTGCLPLLLQENDETVSILELSSWALEGCHTEQVSPDISVITNLSPDHLNRYPDMEAYAHDKAAIVQYQDEDNHCLLYANDDWTDYFSSKANGQIHLFDADSLPSSIDLKVRGAHNTRNAAAAWSVTKLLGINVEQIKHSLEQFAGAPSRQEVIGRTGTHTFINDATSTTPTALTVALETFPEATFIIGGTTKQLPLTDLVTALHKHAGKIVWLKGSGTSQLLQALKIESTAHVQQSLADAFHEALRVTTQGEVVFSPGFTSFELFTNEFDRADQFSALVKQHIQANTPPTIHS